MNNQCKILFVLPIIGFPRHSKRIKMLQDSDFLVSAIAFNRGSHGGRLPDCSIKVISKIRPKKYVERFFRLLMDIPTIRKEIKKCKCK